MLKEVKNIENKIKTDILFENGTYEVYTCFKDLPTTYANLYVDTKRHQYFIETSEGELSAPSGVEFLVQRLRNEFVSKIAECTDKDSLVYRANPNAINSLNGSTLLCDNDIMKKYVTENSDVSMSYNEKEILAEQFIMR